MQGYIPPRLIADAAAVLAHWLALTAMPVLVAWVRYVATWHRWLDVALREVLFERWLSPPIERFVMQWLGTAAAAAMRDDGKQRADDDDTATSTPPRTSSLTSPRHIAFIMDGNRRFARRRHWTSSFRGHLAGFRKLEQVLEWCWRMGVDTVTVYAFSIENFKRPRAEVAMLMSLFKEKLEELCRKSADVREHRVRIRVLGKLELLPDDVQQAAERAMQLTEEHRGATLNICCPYSSSHELDAALDATVLQNDVDAAVGNDNLAFVFQQQLMTANAPPLDLLIRTSGETRLSDFLLWQCTTDRCSIYFLEALWPELSLWDILPLMLAVRGKSGSGKDAHAPVVMREGGDVIPIHDIHDVGRLGTHGNGLLKDLECRAAADDRTISFEATSIASSAILLRQQVRVR